MMLYTLTNVTQRYTDRTVLDIDQLEIEEGRIYALLGPNGAGKTTLLGILGFLEAPTTGALFFRGQPVEASRAAMLHLRRQVVLVDQHPIMFSTSVRSNIEFGLKIRKIEKAERQRVVDEVLETVGLRHFKFARAHELSGGETQRLALARALALSPRVLLCDEPTASVDAENQAVVSGLLQQINATRGTTIIFTTHDRLQAASLAQQTLVLEGGRLAATTYENSYVCTLDSGANGDLRCTLQGRVEIPLPTPPPACRPPGSGRVYIDPEKITLSRRDDQGKSRQEVMGTVVLIMAEGEKIRVVVNIGVLMVVLMDRLHYEHERPAIGETVALRFTGAAVSLLDPCESQS
jgi:tungstate transport system ATP-binding protein